MKRLMMVLACVMSPYTVAEQTDITFIVAGKTANHRQSLTGDTRVLNYHFFAEIFLQPGGTASPSSLQAPPSEHGVPFEDSGYALEMHGGRYASEAQLEANYPDGDYIFHYTAPSVGTVSQVVALGNPKQAGSGIPPAPRIYLSQNGEAVAADKIDPNLDLRVTWSEFSDGGADPLGIMDDLLFVILGDCQGVRRAHSGRPFEDTPYLTYADTSFVIEAERLKPNNAYQLSVEHAVLDTSKDYDVVAFGTFATTTFLDIQTTGTAVGAEDCPRILKQFDAGQAVPQ